MPHRRSVTAWDLVFSGFACVSHCSSPGSSVRCGWVFCCSLFLLIFQIFKRHCKKMLKNYSSFVVRKTLYASWLGNECAISWVRLFCCARWVVCMFQKCVCPWASMLLASTMQYDWACHAVWQCSSALHWFCGFWREKISANEVRYGLLLRFILLIFAGKDEVMQFCWISHNLILLL